MYTVSGLKALFMTLKEVSSKRWYNTIPASMPIFLISGSMDPIGNYSKGVKEVYKKLKKTGHINTSMKIYEGARHEILNETNRKEVFSDIIEWLDDKVQKANDEVTTPVQILDIDEVAEKTEKEEEPQAQAEK